LLPASGLRLEIGFHSDKKKPEFYFSSWSKNLLTEKCMRQSRGNAPTRGLTQPSHLRNISRAMPNCDEGDTKMMYGKSIGSVGRRLKRPGIAGARQWIILFCVATVALPGAELFAAKKSEVSHVAFIWLKRPGNIADQQLLIRAAKSFRKIRGVVRVDAGAGMPIARPGIEQPFDVGAVIVFRDRGALENYEKDPRHLVAMREILQPLAKRYVIYNFSND
jgi:hypothetical protein